MRPFENGEILLKCEYVYTTLLNIHLRSPRKSQNAFFPKHLWFADKILIEVIFYAIKRIIFLLMKGIFEKKNIIRTQQYPESRECDNTFPNPPNRQQNFLLVETGRQPEEFFVFLNHFNILFKNYLNLNVYSNLFA